MNKQIRLIGLLGVTVLGPVAHAKELWHLPPNTVFDLRKPLKVRGDGKLAVYWSHFPRNSVFEDDYMRRTVLNPKTGHQLQSDRVPARILIGDGIAREAWGERHTHAFLPRPARETSAPTWLRLKQGDSYLVLRCLPRFNQRSLEDLAFTPDGGTLYVLGQSRLWKVGAQSGRLLQVVEAPNGRWSRENAALSPDARQIVAMRDRVTLFSTRTGHLQKQFGVGLRTLAGGCGELEARVSFSPDGRNVLAQLAEETWMYSRRGVRLWHGDVDPRASFAPDGHFLLGIQRNEERKCFDVTLSHADRHVLIARIPGIYRNDLDMPFVQLSPDEKTLYIASHSIIWTRAVRVPRIRGLKT